MTRESSYGAGSAIIYFPYMFMMKDVNRWTSNDHVYVRRKDYVLLLANKKSPFQAALFVRWTLASSFL